MGSMPRSASPETLKGGGPPSIPGDFGADGGGRGASRRASLTGLMVVLAASTMLFAAFSSAYIVRRGLSDDWVSLPVPGVLWLNTAILLASSAALEVARRALRAGRRNDFNRFWTLGTALGAAFLLGQAYAWRQLSDAGIYVATNPSSSFFYVFTAAHAIHLLGGMSALIYVNVQAVRLRLGPGKRTAVEVGALFWHFLDALWIYLMALFLFWG